MNVSVIIPLHNPNQQTLRQILTVLRKQRFSGKKEVIQVNQDLGLAASLNYGIKKAKYPYVISLHQDCIPENERWLTTLLAPFKDKNIVASVSKVYLPESLWSSFDVSARALTIKECGTITPLMDEKGCAYRKSALHRVGYFNEKDFHSAGEDFDMYLKLSSWGRIAYPKCKVFHIHPTTQQNRVRKIYQNANGYGALTRIYGVKMHRWYAGLLNAIPFIGILSLAMSYPWRRAGILGAHYIFLIPLVHINYILGFWKGFLMKRQTI